MFIKLFIALFGILFIVLGCVKLLHKINNQSTKKKKPSKPTTTPGALAPNLPLPILDISNGMIERSDNSIITGIKIHPVNASLFDATERDEEAKREGRLFASLRQPFSVISIQNTPDNSSQSAAIDKALEEIDIELANLITTGDASTRKQLLLFRRDILTKISNDETDAQKYAAPTQTQTYITLLTQPRRNTNPKELGKEAANALLARAAGLGFACSLLDDDDLFWVLKAYFDEPPAPGKKVDPYNLFPVCAS